MKKVLIIVNKSWEVDPVISAMTASKIKPLGFPLPDPLNMPVPGWRKPKPPGPAQPRAVFDIYSTVERRPADLLLSAVVWCIEDLMRPGANTSSSAEKAVQLEALFKSEKEVDLVIAFGTGGFNDRHTSFNGSVVIGSEFFSYNAVPDNPDSQFRHPGLNRHLPTNLPDARAKDLFKIFSDKFRDIVESKLLPTPNEPARKPKVMAASNFVAISNVNITNYNDYAWADDEGLKAYHEQNVKSPVGSIETTHGMIRLCCDWPVIFVSAISDRLGYFASEVSPGQNFVASFNGGVFLSYFIPELISVT